MARINRSELTKLEILRVAMKKFLEDGYTNTSVKAICNELDMSPGNLTFHFPTKEHLLVAMIEQLCSFQWQLIQEEVEEGDTAVIAVCRELAFMVVMSEEDEAIKDLFISAYSSPLCLEFIRKNDRERSKEIFKEYCSDWDEIRFREAEILVSGIEYATLMTTGDPFSMEARICGALTQILRIYNVPEELRRIKIERVLSMDYRKIGHQVLLEFRKYVEQSSEQALIGLLKGQE
ncbi:MAG: TetR/AcrR family transcriptional regulator [Clostridia bacterium]|nr:TetR/AcrR family transcriptional regulator [Clostridia bacterium]